MKVEMGKKYTSNGKKVRILCVDRPDSVYTVVAMREDGAVSHFKKDGTSINGKWDSYNLIEVWEPTVGEWCWFWDDNNYNTILAKFELIHNDKGFKCNAGGYWQHCVKFTGELPEHLKNINNGEI
jgi:hypothetical protein